MESLPTKHKVVLIGDAGVGKTALLTRLIKNYFYDSYCPTVGTGFGFWDTCINDVTIRLHIWDTAGTEQYRALAPIFYQNAEAAIVCYSQTDPQSEKAVNFWIQKFTDSAGKIPLIAIAANKSDAVSERDCRAMKQFADENKYIFSEASAKTGEGVVEIFQKVAEMVLKNSMPVSQLIVEPKFVKFSSQLESEKKKCC